MKAMARLAIGAVLLQVSPVGGAEAANKKTLVIPAAPVTACYPVTRNGIEVPGACQEVDVTCGGVGARRATIIIRRPLVQTGGNVIFFTGELSVARYSKNNVRRERILEPLLNDGFSTFEVFYETPNYEVDDIAANRNPDYPSVPGAPASDGIFHAVDGAGIDYTCSADAIMRYIVDRYVVVHTSNVCAAGNSGGGQQIAGALTLFNGEEYLKSAVISAGPPLAQFYEMCAGTEGLNVPHSERNAATERAGPHMPFGAPNGGFSPRELIDKLVGTYDASKYSFPGRNICARDLTPKDGHEERLLRGQSLVLSGGVNATNHRPRDYTYTTFVDFVSAAEDASGAGTSPFGNRQGNYYYDMVALNNPFNSDRTIIGDFGNDHPPTQAQLDGDTHVVDTYMNALGQTPGADAIRQKLRQRCAP